MDALKRAGSNNTEQEGRERADLLERGAETPANISHLIHDTADQAAIALPGRPISNVSLIVRPTGKMPSCSVVETPRTQQHG